MRPGIYVIESETQYQITWFPPGRPDGVVRTGNARQMKRYHRANAEWLPIIERREITVSPWETIEVEDLDESAPEEGS